ncbi:unnamed protein product [Ceratitis capitata]|uniref:(Mediterranean fruit fly) hypothetical protein n=1 Tax=Ceratitis capitata TaxID=7213 RepID=A0A811UFV1_CERCA|nr:unnamed protein product [Ceratitis capitata]
MGVQTGLHANATPPPVSQIRRLPVAREFVSGAEQLHQQTCVTMRSANQPTKYLQSEVHMDNCRLIDPSSEKCKWT